MNMLNDILPVVTCLNGAVSNARLYAANHPHVMRYLERALCQLQQVFPLGDKITFVVLDDVMVVNNQAMTAKTPQLEQFIQILKKSGVERLSFSPELTLESLAQLVGDLAARDQVVIRSTPGITLGRVMMDSPADDHAPQTPVTAEISERLAAMADCRQKAMENLKDIFHRISVSHRISSFGLVEMVNGFVHGMLHNVNPLRMLASLKTSDEYTFTHAVNVCILTMVQAESLGIDGQMLHDIGIAAALHDAGKMFVPDDILNKPDKLTDAEWHHMRAHSTEGAQYILRLQGIPRLAFLAALEHHIRYDGGGYPDLGNGWRPHIVSQMIAVADVFDAMRSRRPYKEPKPDHLIIKILREDSGKAFNPRLVNNFLRLIKT